MSTATPVPITAELTGDDARRTLREAGAGTILKEAFVRLRYGDGFSHSRSMAFLTSLVLVQGTIALVGLASALGTRQVANGIVTAIHDIAPGPAGRLLTSAVEQAREAGTSGDRLALVLGLFGTVVSGTTAMGQLERGLNRMYGIERDRPTAQKYGRALLLALSAGVLLSFAFFAIGFGPAIGRAFDNDGLADVWAWLRWPLGLLVMSAAIALLFRWCPNRRQPGWSWLAFASSVAVVLWTVITVAMGLVFQVSSSFGDTYGPLAGIVALQFWALLSAVALFYAGAVAAQLEAVRAGVPAPADAPQAQPATVGARPSALVS